MSLLDSKIYKLIYNIIRKNKALNYSAHRIMQSELIRKIPLYNKIYKKIIIDKAERFINKPDIIEFEITNMCNSRCIMCPPEVHAGKDIIDHNLFKKIAKEAIEIGIKRMILTGGEPLLDKNIFNKIKYAKEIGFDYIHMFTNGSLLTDNNIKKLLKSNLDSLTISFDSAVKEEYERIRIGLKFDKIVENIKKLYNQKKELPKKFFLLRLNMVTLPQNINSRKVFINKFKNYADILEIIDPHDFGGTIDIDSSSYEYTQKTRDPCHILFKKVCITPKGFLKKCSIDYSENAIMGNLLKNNLIEILDSRIYKIKRQHLNYNFIEKVCDTCTHKESWWVDY